MATKDPEARKAYQRAWMKAYYLAHRDEKRAAARANHSLHREQNNAYRKARNTALKGGISTDGPCVVCGWNLTPNDRHRLVAGGAYSIDNVVLLCPNHHRLAHQGATRRSPQ